MAEFHSMSELLAMKMDVVIDKQEALLNGNQIR